MCDEADIRAKWDQRYREQLGGQAPEACRALVHYAHLLPETGYALDVACGFGANALFLARRGLRVEAWDLSAVAIGALRQSSRALGLEVNAEVHDVVASPPQPDRFDLVVVSHFWEPALCPRLVAALRPGGLLVYQTFIRAAVSGRGPRNPEFRLRANELLRAFAVLQILAYHEEGRVGDLATGFRDEALLVGRRPDEDEHAATELTASERGEGES